MAYIGYGYYKDDKGVYQLINGKKLYLDKNKPYYIICRKGNLSKKVVQILSFYGYNVSLVKNF